MNPQREDTGSRTPTNGSSKALCDVYMEVPKSLANFQLLRPEELVCVIPALQTNARVGSGAASGAAQVSRNEPDFDEVRQGPCGLGSRGGTLTVCGEKEIRSQLLLLSGVLCVYSGNDCILNAD
jgi:hypothetical protein